MSAPTMYQNLKMTGFQPRTVIQLSANVPIP